MTRNDTYDSTLYFFAHIAREKGKEIGGRVRSVMSDIEWPFARPLAFQCEAKC